jgi:hypothetical protein
VMPRAVGAFAIVVAFIAAGAGTAGVAEELPVRAALFVTLPITNGFSDATDALVETQGLVREALVTGDTVRLVDRLQDSDAVLTVLGRGTGYDELTAALRELDPSVVASPVMLRANERYIEAMIAVGPCGEAATSATRHATSASCYRKIVVGLADRDARQRDAKARNPWTACAGALTKDVQAWVTENASRLLALHR